MLGPNADPEVIALVQRATEEGASPAGGPVRPALMHLASPILMAPRQGFEVAAVVQVGQQTDPEDAERTNAIQKHRETFRRHGFDDYAIDFSYVKPVAIEAMATALVALEARSGASPASTESAALNANYDLYLSSQAMWNALDNVRLLAMRLRRTDPVNAGHLLRFCASAGVVGSVLRADDDSDPAPLSIRDTALFTQVQERADKLLDADDQLRLSLARLAAITASIPREAAEQIEFMVQGFLSRLEDVRTALDKKIAWAADLSGALSEKLRQNAEALLGGTVRQHDSTCRAGDDEYGNEQPCTCDVPRLLAAARNASAQEERQRIVSFLRLEADALERMGHQGAAVLRTEADAVERQPVGYVADALSPAASGERARRRTVNAKDAMLRLPHDETAPEKLYSFPNPDALIVAFRALNQEVYLFADDEQRSRDRVTVSYDHVAYVLMLANAYLDLTMYELGQECCVEKLRDIWRARRAAAKG